MSSDSSKKRLKILVPMIIAGTALFGAYVYYLFADEAPKAEATSGQSQNTIESKFKASVPKQTETDMEENRGEDIDLKMQREDSIRDAMIEKEKLTKEKANKKIKATIADGIGRKKNSSAGKAINVSPATDISSKDVVASVSNNNNRKGYKKSNSIGRTNRANEDKVEEAMPAILATEKRKRKESDVATGWGEADEIANESPAVATAELVELEAIIHGNQKVSSQNTKIELRFVRGIPACNVPPNKIITGKVYNVMGSRLYVNVALLCGKTRRNFKVYDNDNEDGLYVENLNTMDEAKKSSFRSLISQGSSLISSKLGVPTAGSVINTTADAGFNDNISVNIESGKLVKLVEVLK